MFWILIAILGIVGTLLVYGLGNPDSGFGKKVYKIWPFGQPQWVQRRVAERSHQAAAAMEQEAAAQPDVEQNLRRADVGSFVQILGRQIRFVGEMLLLELQYFGSNKADKRHQKPSGEMLREFQAYMLAGKRMLMEQPMAEGLELSWYLYNNVTDRARGFFEYMKGTETKPGPGVLFAKGNQGNDVVIDALGKKWLAMDILWLDFRIVGGATPVQNGPDGHMARAACVLSREITGGKAGNYTLGDEWLMSIDLRSGGGSKTLWVGHQVDPTVDLEDVTV